MHVNFPEPAKRSADLFVHLAQRDAGSVTKRLLASVEQARAFGEQRNQRLGIRFNRDLCGSQILAASNLSEKDFTELVNQVISNSGSNRSVVRTVRVARSLADLDQCETIKSEHLSQAWNWQAQAAAIQRGEEINYLESV